MNGKLFYRLEDKVTHQGLWYDFKGEFTGLIHDKFAFCMNSQLPMPFDIKLVGWLSATETLDELFNWFSKEDIQNLEEYGYRVAIYQASEYRYHNNHWIINKDSSRLVEQLSLVLETT